MLDVHLRKQAIRAGNSLAFRITMREAKALGVREGDLLDVDVRPAGGLDLRRAVFFRDGRGSVAHDGEVGRAHDLGG